jgi:hypothetical protein
MAKRRQSGVALTESEPPTTKRHKQVVNPFLQVLEQIRCLEGLTGDICWIIVQYVGRDLPTQVSIQGNVLPIREDFGEDNFHTWADQLASVSRSLLFTDSKAWPVRCLTQADFPILHAATTCAYIDGEHYISCVYRVSLCDRRVDIWPPARVHQIVGGFVLTPITPVYNTENQDLFETSTDARRASVFDAKNQKSLSYVFRGRSETRETLNHYLSENSSKKHCLDMSSFYLNNRVGKGDRIIFRKSGVCFETSMLPGVTHVHVGRNIILVQSKQNHGEELIGLRPSSDDPAICIVVGVMNLDEHVGFSWRSSISIHDDTVYWWGAFESPSQLRRSWTIHSASCAPDDTFGNMLGQHQLTYEHAIGLRRVLPFTRQSDGRSGFFVCWNQRKDGSDNSELLRDEDYSADFRFCGFFA